MPHVTLVPFTGFRIREPEMLSLGMRLPGLRARGKAVAQLPSLGLLTLAGLTPDGWEMSYHAAPGDDEALAQRIIDERPTLVALSALTAGVLDAYRFAARMRAAGIPTVIGGLHATTCPDEAEQFVDAVVIGEGEPVWRDMLRDAESGRLQPRYRPAAPFEMTEAPTPRFDLLNGHASPRYTVQTQRGCPLACDFCAASRLLGPFREKPVENIRREFEALRRLHRRPLIELADDNTFAGPRDPAPLFDALAGLKTRWFTEVDWRIGERPDVLNGLAASGCVQALIGVESMVFQHRGMGQKTADFSRMMHAIEAIQDAGVAVIGCFLVGSDGETLDSIARLRDFILAGPFADIQLTVTTPFPGTALRARLESENRILPDRDWTCYSLFDVVHQPDRMTPDELQQAFYELIGAVFAPEPTRRRDAIRAETWRKRA